MRQETKNIRNQKSYDKKMDFLVQSLSHIPRWVRLVQKMRAKNSHAWAPLSEQDGSKEKRENVVVEHEQNIANFLY
jgi:hypothetical protein